VSNAFNRPRPFQRVYADQATPVVNAIHAHRTDLQVARQDGDEQSILAILGPLGEAYRQLAQLDPAVECGEEALALALKLGNETALITNGIRLATAYQYRNEQARALPLFQQALERARARGFMVDFALQHLGKCLVELGQKDEALACFHEALALRRAKGDAGLIASTEEAIEGAAKR
jgi:tetratricopeptide (TPR) repeat protein